MPTDTQALFDKICALSAERIQEVEDFADFIAPAHRIVPSLGPSL